MKKIIFGSSLVLAMTMSLIYSCSDKFLDTTPTASTNSVILANDKGVNALLIGAYHGFVGGLHQNGWFGDWVWSSSVSNWVWGGVASDDATKGSYLGDQSSIIPVEDYTLDASNDYALGRWNGNYECIGRANDVLRVMASATDITDENRIQYEAQARFLRAWFHFEAKRVFNNIPYITEAVADPAKVPNNIDAWPLIEQDLQFGVDNLPVDQADPGRPTKYAAEAVLARVYLFQHKFTAAKTLLDDIIGSGKYSLAPNFEDNFLIAKTNNQESIFEIQYAVNDGASDSPNGNYGDALNYPQDIDGLGTCCAFYQPTQNSVNAFKTDANGLPYLDTYNDSNFKNDMGLVSTDVYIPDTVQTVDPRLDFTVGRRGIPFLDWGIMRGNSWLRDQGNAGPYVNRKNMFKKSEKGIYSTTTGWATGVNANNYRAYRLGHIILWRAEVAIEEGDLPKALQLVNMIRTRAASKVVMGRCRTYSLPSQDGLDVDPNTPAANYKVSPYPSFPDAAYATKAVRMEERLEFCMEGLRHFDLVRWGVAADVINAYMEKDRAFRSLFGGATPKHFTAGKNEYAPIPHSQIELEGSDILTQNPGY
jgi:starch-binding outer membrane protein, SusD/RagB family